MRYTILSLFPRILEAYFAESILARAVKAGAVEYSLVNIRDYALDKHRSCDDAPYGGGAGMLMLPEPLAGALEAAGARRKGAGQSAPDRPRVIYLSPSGRLFDQALARDLAQEEHLLLLCGRYEGIDQRVIDAYVDDEVSVGDYVLSSGEAAAVIIVDATARLVSEVISPRSLVEESFCGGLLEYPQYTRPEVFDGMAVPQVLLSGHHAKIRRWRLEKRVEKTLALRPDLAAAGEAAGLFDEETRAIITQCREKTARGNDERNQSD
ncbi:MAG: tRNA (guanosine(37)-N1)-methyltransferase TrmD [Treponema sp.]|jgi:tRNA (guanine37-N1)-methyltransferase|nr:tRNA (guanosine(37)-N1)-methyltransferase TrmD [Treponema sp.]